MDALYEEVDVGSVVKLAASCLSIFNALLTHPKTQKSIGKNDSGKSLDPVNAWLSLNLRKLLQWKSTWSLNTDDSDGLLVYLVGDEAYERIKDVLQGIFSKLCHIQKTRRRPDDSGSSSSSSAGEKIKSWWRKSSSKTIDLQRRDQEELLNAVDDLSKSIDHLSVCSVNAFRTKEKERVYSEHHFWEPEAWLPPFDTCIPDRLASVALFSTCHSVGTTFGLHLHVPSPEELLDPSMMSYNMLGNATSLDDAFDITFNTPSNTNQVLHGDVVKPLNIDMLQELGRGARIQMDCAEHSLSAVFIVEKSFAQLGHPNLQWIDNLTIQSKALKLPSLTANVPLTKVQKAQLACALVYTTYALLGTPWLVNLQIRNMCRVSSQDDICPYVLIFKRDHHQSLGTNFDQNISESTQLHQLGIALTEIALGKTATELDMEEPVPWSQRMAVLPDVKRAMGYHYGEAVGFCLRKRQCPSFSNNMSKFDERSRDQWRQHLQVLLAEYRDQVIPHMYEVIHISEPTYDVLSPDLINKASAVEAW